MQRRFFLALFLLTIATVPAFAQTKANRKTIRALQADIGYLASDALEGRRTGTEGERKAGDYIIRRYETLRIPAYAPAYRHPYTFVWGREPGASAIVLGGQAMPFGEDAFPFPFSAAADVSGDVLTDVQEQGAIWTLPLYASADEAADPHFDAEKAAWEKAREAAKTGASGVVFYDAFGSSYPPVFSARSEYETIAIPAVFVGHKVWQGLTANDVNAVAVQLHIHLVKPERTGNNIAAFINNHAPLTVVLGAHYDHLGRNEDGGSLYAGKEPQIHNGADDNASGTAALLQLAAWVKQHKLRKYNYLFVHFSGEELGLFGSKAFIKETNIDSTHIAYMLNMDMVGRLNDSTRALTVGGIGTSPAWGAAVESLRKARFKISADSSGIGPSDHTSFYNAGIPVLFFFTGIHPDYHKPSDDADKINYTGEAAVIRAIEGVVKDMEQAPRPRFTPTKQNSISRVRFKITLGIMPDYSWSGEGVRVDGISEGRPAQKAGIIAGDIIIRLGDDEVKGMQSYMEALSHQQAGTQRVVTIRRGDQLLKLNIVF